MKYHSTIRITRDSKRWILITLSFEKNDKAISFLNCMNTQGQVYPNVKTIFFVWILGFSRHVFLTRKQMFSRKPKISDYILLLLGE